MGNEPVDSTIVLALPDAEATRRLGCAIGHCTPPGSTVLLQGDLGSGKTTLAQGLGQCLNILEPIVSPTFALLHEYDDGRLPLYHFDLYRLSPDQVPALGPEQYWDGVEVPSGIVLIEWCDRLPFRPEASLNVALESVACCDSTSGQTTDPGRIAKLTLTGRPGISLEAIAVAFEAIALGETPDKTWRK
ncbi:MAG: tRNA (adenosine(37)-N6)-threonylcarbamoyltransferase complex ATPase subunit type 1 TsaE [Elainellaceae cyanobacterium]